jgi:NAD-dependent aldehyde dehydrogenases
MRASTTAASRATRPSASSSPTQLYEPFLEKFTAKIAEVEATDPTAADSALGPLSSLKAAEGLDEQVKRAIEHGATLVHGGTRDGAFFPTTVLTDITPENPASKEEFFGPVAQVYRAKDEADAVRIANDTPFGWARTSTPPTRSRRSASPTASRPAWCS